jgi:ABC-2 type transport system ATP-binding protein
VADPFIIETADLWKDYDGVEAVRGLNLQVPFGSIYGFLGRNGAGKTTTIKVLLGMARPTSGHARVFGLAADVQEASVDIRRRTGFVSDDKDLYDYMTVEGMIHFTAAFFPRWRGDLEQRYLRRFELPRTRKVKALSRGMRTKLALLLALCRGAELLVLDEPTSGLDPAMTEEVLQALVAHVAREEMTVFFSSHQIAEVDQIADRVAIIDHGRGGDRCARRPPGELPPHRAGVRRRSARAGVPRGGRRTRAAKGPCDHRAVERGSRADPRGGACARPGVGGRRSRHAQRDLPREGHRGGLTCSGTSRGWRPAGGS